MVRRKKEVVFHGTREEADGCVLDIDIPCPEFYNALFHEILDEKFTKVNIELYLGLVEHNDAQRRKPESKRKGCSKSLTSFQEKDAKMRDMSDEKVILRDRKKVIHEIGPHLSEEWWKQKWFSYAIIAYSKKEATRILAFGYISDEGKIRIFIRYKTLHQPTRTAEEVINVIRSRLTWFLEN